MTSPQATAVEAVKQQVREGQKMVMLENENLRQFAIQQPRNIDKVKESCLLELDLSKEFAQSAYYSIPYKDRSGENEVTNLVEGLSIKAAMMIARYFGNNANRGRLIDETDDYVTVEGYFLDYESSMITARQIHISKKGWNRKTKTFYVLPADRLRIAIQAGQSKAIRNAILASVPEFIKIEVFNRAKQIVAGMADKKSKVEILKKLLKDLHMEFGVTTLQISKLFGNKKKLSENEVIKLQGMLTALREGHATKEEIFGGKKSELPPQQMTLNDINK